jgi:hypothetical protein
MIPAAAPTVEPARLDPLTRFWWVRLPLVGRRLSVGTFLTLSDGWQLLAAPLLAAWIPPVALVAGLLFGATHATFGTVFTESAVFLALAVVIGLTSAQLGLWLTLGFAFGDFFIAHPDWSASGELVFGFGDAPILDHLYQVRLPLILQYGLLALLTTGIPAAVKSLLGQLGFVGRLPAGLAFAVLAVGHAVLAWLLVYFWAQAVAVLVVPIYSWGSGFSAADPSTLNLQNNGAQLALLGAIAAVVRFVLQVQALGETATGRRVRAMADEMNASTPVQPLADRIPLLLRIIGRTAWAVLLLSGLFVDAFDAILLGAIIFAFQLVRAGWIRLPFGAWTTTAQRIPLLFRLAFGFAIVWIIALQLQGFLIQNATDFRPLALLTGTSLAVFLVLAPPRLSNGTDAERAPTSEPVP